MENQLAYLPISLPSKGLTYSGIKLEDIRIRPYCGEDAIILAQIDSSNFEQAYLLIMQRVLMGIDPKRLTLGDRLYIVMWEYINSYSEFVKETTICGHCFKHVEYNVDLRTLGRVELPDDYKEPKEVTLPSGRKVNLRMLTVGDRIEILNYSAQHDDHLLYECALSVVSTNNVLTEMEQLKTPKVGDVATIKAFQEKWKHGTDFTAKVKCPKCEQEDDLIVPFRFEFIFPYGDSLTDTFGTRV